MRLDKHPILMQAHNVVQAIEECGASEELTNAVVKAGELMEEINKLVDKLIEIGTITREGWMSVDSSQIERARYIEADKAMEIEFKRGGAVYRYHDVPEDIFDGLLKAESAGKYLGTSIKGVFEFTKMGG